MRIMVYSLLWVIQDLYHQPCDILTPCLGRRLLRRVGLRDIAGPQSFSKGRDTAKARDKKCQPTLNRDLG